MVGPDGERILSTRVGWDPAKNAHLRDRDRLIIVRLQEPPDHDGCADCDRCGQWRHVFHRYIRLQGDWVSVLSWPPGCKRSREWRKVSIFIEIPFKK